MASPSVAAPIYAAIRFIGFELNGLIEPYLSFSDPYYTMDKTLGIPCFTQEKTGMVAGFFCLCAPVFLFLL